MLPTSACFPLHPRDAVLEIVESELNIAFLQNVLGRVAWDVLRGLCVEVCFYNTISGSLRERERGREKG